MGVRQDVPEDQSKWIFEPGLLTGEVASQLMEAMVR